MSLSFYFKDVLNSLSIKKEKVDELWLNLTKHYYQLHRHYHSFEHIESMLKLFSKANPRFSILRNKNENFPREQRTELILTVFYHDVIYDPKRADNEQKSAEFFVQELGDFLPIEVVNHVVAMILATQHHELNDVNDLAMAHFLDLDLSILGSSEEKYQDYAYNIRQEYRHLSDEDYRKGRIAVLEKFLQRERLYFTDWFYQRLEQQARQNLQAEIEFLKTWE